MEQSDIGVYGLGTMGRNLALDLEEKGFTVSVYNQMAPKEEGTVRSFLENEGRDKNFIGSYSARYFIQSIKKPRKVLIMVKAGPTVDYVMQELRRYLSKGDILVDGSNSHYSDTIRRVDKMKSKGYHFVGMGVSWGDKKGVRSGPSLMAGGDKRGWNTLKPILETIAAKNPAGEPCCAWLGRDGAGHFAMMVHNGIEYALMQLLAEAYHTLHTGLSMPDREIGHTFQSWNEGSLNSYLLDITCDIINNRGAKGNSVPGSVPDVSVQQDRGRQAALAALELGVPAPLMSAAVYAQVLTGFKVLREEASATWPSVLPERLGGRHPILQSLRQALLASSLVAYAEGFSMLKAADREWGWEIPLSAAARIWQGGSVIRSALLQPVAGTFREAPNLSNLMLAPVFRKYFAGSHEGWRQLISRSAEHGIPVPGMSAALGYFDMLRSRQLPTSLIQAQRDYIGAHACERPGHHMDALSRPDRKETASSS